MKHITVIEAKRMGCPWILNFKREFKRFGIPGLYILEFEHGVKVGISKNVKKRLEHYLNPWSVRPKGVTVFSCGNPRRIEAKIIAHFSDNIKAGSNEFLHEISSEAVIKFIECDPYYKK